MKDAIAEVKGEAEKQQRICFAYIQEMLKKSPDAGGLEYVAVALVVWNTCRAYDADWISRIACS